MTGTTRPSASPRRCPRCGAPSAERVRPFCSKRCRDIDLGHWLEGRYALPVVEDDGSEFNPAEDR